MNRLRGILFAVVFAVAFAGAVWALDTQEVKVEYSADDYIETEKMKMHSKVFHAPGKERKEMYMGETGGEPNSIMIIRWDKGVIWTLMPQMGMYTEGSMGAGEQGSEGDMKITEQSVVGEEVIEGRKTTKSKVIMKDSKGRAFGGFMWVTKEGIQVKMDAIFKSEKEKMRMKMELKDLKIEKQDPALFEIPAGYTKMGMPGGAFTPPPQKTGKETMTKAKDDDDDDDDEDEDETRDSRKSRSLNKLKGLIGR